MPYIRERSARYVEIDSGGSTRLAVVAVPGAPVTLTGEGLGAFSNKLNSITVRADGAGVASTTFTATPGTVNFVPIIVGSAMTSDNIHIIINVAPPSLE